MKIIDNGNNIMIELKNLDELELLRAFVAGAKNCEIAENTAFAESSVRNYRQNFVGLLHRSFEEIKKDREVDQ